MKTMQPSTKEVRDRVVEETRSTPAEPTRKGFSSALVAAGIVLAFAAGFLIGFLLWGTDGDETDPIVAGGGDLTARQEQMIEVYDDYIEAWKAGDGDAAAALFTPWGRMEILGIESRVDDGTLAAFIDRTPVPSIEVLEPLVVSKDAIVNHHIFGGSGYENIVKFTHDGDVLLTSHVLTP